MAIKTNTGFEIGSIVPIDSRIALTQEEMLNVNDNVMPDKYFSVSQTDGKLYLYDKSAEPNEVTGKFSLLEGGEGAQIWEGTRAEYELEKDTIAPGTLIVITDDEGQIGSVFYDCTQEEYDALPDDKLSNGIAYMISEEGSTTVKLVRNGKEISGGSDLQAGEAISIEYKKIERHETVKPLGYYTTVDPDSYQGEIEPFPESGRLYYSYSGRVIYYVIVMPDYISTYSDLTFGYSSYSPSGPYVAGTKDVLTLEPNTTCGFITFVEAKGDKVIFRLGSGCPSAFLEGFTTEVNIDKEGNFIDVVYDDESIKLSKDNKIYVNSNFDTESTLTGSFIDEENPIAVNTNVIATRDFVAAAQSDYNENNKQSLNYIRNKPNFVNGILYDNSNFITKYYTQLNVKDSQGTNYYYTTLDDVMFPNITISPDKTLNAYIEIYGIIPDDYYAAKSITADMSINSELRTVSLLNRAPGDILCGFSSGGASGGASATVFYDSYSKEMSMLRLRVESYNWHSGGTRTPSSCTLRCSILTMEKFEDTPVRLSLTDEQLEEDKVFGYNPAKDEWNEAGGDAVIKVEELPEELENKVYICNVDTTFYPFETAANYDVETAEAVLRDALDAIGVTYQITKTDSSVLAELDYDNSKNEMRVYYPENAVAKNVTKIKYEVALSGDCAWKSNQNGETDYLFVTVSHIVLGWSGEGVDITKTVYAKDVELATKEYVDSLPAGDSKWGRNVRKDTIDGGELQYIEDENGVVIYCYTDVINDATSILSLGHDDTGEEISRGEASFFGGVNTEGRFCGIHVNCNGNLDLTSHSITVNGSGTADAGKFLTLDENGRVVATKIDIAEEKSY